MSERTDSERLDWVEVHWPDIDPPTPRTGWCWEVDSPVGYGEARTLRAAIDAAMAMDATP